MKNITQKNLKKILDHLADDLIKDEKKLKKFINRWTRNFHQYSLINTVLIYYQKPDFSIVAGYRKWQKVGRQVKKGEKAIKIRAPLIYKKKEKNEDNEEEYIKGYRLVNVFDISQTDGEKIIFGNAEYVKNDIDFNYFFEKCPYPITIKDLGMANGKTDGDNIYLSPKHGAAMITTMFHEMAHIILDHCTSFGDDMSHEVQAEAVSYICSTFFGVENNKSKYYISIHGGDEDILTGHGVEILSTAEKIIKIFK